MMSSFAPESRRIGVPKKALIIPIRHPMTVAAARECTMARLTWPYSFLP